MASASDTRGALRRHLDAGNVTLAVLAAQARAGVIETSVAAAAVGELGLDPDAAEPMLA